MRIHVLATAVGLATLLAGERPAAVSAIPGVVAADAKWEFIWQDFKTADGIVGTPDGGAADVHRSRSRGQQDLRGAHARRPGTA
jgi:hypothetical protein